MAKDRRSTYASLLAVQLLFGLFPVAVKKVLHGDGTPLAPLHLLAVRVAGAAAVLVAVHPVLVRNPLPVVREFPRLALLTMLGVVLNMGLFLVGLAKTTAVEAVLVITTIPVFTYALALGDVLILTNALFFSAFLVLAKPVMDRFDPLSVTAWMFALGAILVLPGAIATGLPADAADLTLESALWLAFIVAGPSVLTYLLNARALRHVHASTVAAFTYVQPIFAAVAAYLVLGQELEGRVLPAAALVFAGLWFVARRDPKVLEGDVVAE
ncbi:MAG: DMT family transporter [Halobacteriales archaeon]|nr:DMT family transporter [Halobacteriales archaeon]